MASQTRPNLFTIPPHRAFADALVAGLCALFGRTMEGLARGIVLVPNNRAARAITDAFVRKSDAGLLLPRIIAIGDLELEARIGGALDPSDETVPPAVTTMERLMLLASEVQRQMGVSAAEAVRLADDLARTLDQLIFEEIELQRLVSIAANLPDLSLHWQKSLDHLSVILSNWPTSLEKRGFIDLADRRNRLLNAMAKRWRSNAPPGYIVAAGINTTAPAIARVLRTVSRLSRGMVVFHALDLTMPDDEWQALGPHEPDPLSGRKKLSIESHPQFHLKLLLDRIGVSRHEVQTWRWSAGRSAPASRTRTVANAMKPPRYTARWEQLPAVERRLSGVRALELSDPAEEAQVIAIALREAVEKPGRTAAFVTPDRSLARRVSAHLKRWEIEADDSAGHPLSETSPGTFLLALATAAAERFSPVPLLALLKHPFAKGESRISWLDGVRSLDFLLRGPRPPSGLSAMSDYLRREEVHRNSIGREAAAFWERAKITLNPLEGVFADASASLSSILKALRETASHLSDNGIWAGAEGRGLSELFAELEAVADNGPSRIHSKEVPQLLRQMMKRVSIRPSYGQHPRVFIWGLLEARLQHADFVVLGGLNEGTWPALPSPDPWLAPRIRKELGLPSLERRIGLLAHDFAIGLGAPQVLITRAKRDARAPAVASRFWLRLEAMTGGLTRSANHRKWTRAIDRPVRHEWKKRPAPRPLLKDRPVMVSVTEVDRLKADPFAFYASRLLRLSKLDEIDADPGASWRGSAVHKILECWMKEDDCDPAKLRPRAKMLLDLNAEHPMMTAFWQPRLFEAVEFVARKVAEFKAEGRLPFGAELDGSIEIGSITLRGRADRIDKLPDGTLIIVDYKTGTPPSARAVTAGFSMQLGLLGIIAEHGGFKDIQGKPRGFEYWSLSKKHGRLGFITSPVSGKTGLKPSDFISVAEQSFVSAASRWLIGSEAFTAKLHPEYSPYDDYDQLMRLEEWYGRDS